MNKILTTLALTAFAGSSLAFADGAIDGLSVKAKVDFESEYIFRGKQYSDNNLQTKVAAEYALPTQGVNASVYAGGFLMSPFTQIANEAVIFGGVKFEPLEKTLIDVGYNYYSYPNQASANAGLPGGATNSATNRSVYNSSNEIYVGAVFAQWKEIATPSLYVYYNFDLSQTTTEFAVRRTFSGSDYGIAGVDLILAAYTGYLQADAYNGDQRSGVQKWSNAYAYAGASADIAYNVTNASRVGLGIRYAANNDGTGNKGGVLPGQPGLTPSTRLSGNNSSNFWYGIWAEFKY